MRALRDGCRVPACREDRTRRRADKLRAVEETDLRYAYIVGSVRPQCNDVRDDAAGRRGGQRDGR